MSEIKATYKVKSTLEGLTLEEIVKAVMEILRPEEVEELEESESVPELAVKSYKAFNDYPDMLRAKHIKAILDISYTKAYEVLASHKCPSLTIGKRKMVRKEAFIQYLIDNENQDLID